MIEIPLLERIAILEGRITRLLAEVQALKQRNRELRIWINELLADRRQHEHADLPQEMRPV